MCLAALSEGFSASGVVSGVVSGSFYLFIVNIYKLFEIIVVYKIVKKNKIKI